MACNNEKRSPTGTITSAFSVKSTLRTQKVRGQKLSPSARYTIAPKARRGEVMQAIFAIFLREFLREFG
jgi:hypothetical protein